MALPTMNGFWSSRKNVYEQAIVRHRNHEDDFRSKWGETATYFKNSDVRSAKQQAWSSSQAYQDKCADAYQSSVEKDIKASNLKRRRDKLAQKLSDENKAYQAQMRGLSGSNYNRLEDMRSRAEELKSAREENRQKVAEEKLYQFWRENNPDLRKVESQIMKEKVIGEWGDQVVDKEQRLESARQEKRDFEMEMERERQVALEVERRKEEEKLKEEKSLKEILREQMFEFKEREREAETWKMQQEELLKQQWELERIEEVQRQREEERKKKDLGRALLRQHKAQMMRKSRVIQEELEQDAKLLQSLIEREQEQVALQSARREKARADARWMKQVIEDQLRLEKEREAELDMLYQDEAARMWQKREAEWNKERQARHRLMAEVLESRQHQISGKLEELRHQQEESLQRREELVREMEVAQQLTRRDAERDQENKMTTRVELEEQMMARKEREHLSSREAADAMRMERRDEADYEDLLRQETQRMRLENQSPRFHGRSRRQAWD